MTSNEVIGTNFLQQIYKLLNTTVPFNQFVTSLKLNSANQMIPDADFKEWLDSLGYKVKMSQSINSFLESSKPHNQVLAKIKSAFTKPDQLPTRKTIDSAWLNSPFQPSFFSAAFVTASDLIKQAPVAFNSAGELIAGGFKLTKYAVYIALPIAAWFIWKNKDRLSNMAMSRLERKA